MAKTAPELINTDAWGVFRTSARIPSVTIEVGTDTISVVASEAAGEERERLFRAQAERVPQFAEYDKKAGSVIPVIILTPAERGGGVNA